MPAGCAVRAMVVYTAPEHNSQVVTRCLNHSRPEIEQGVFEAEHLIRSESSLATYHNDIETQRHSIVVPFENPPGK
ncbi:hypothetical protein NPIL_18471 [Nephila pilipes]|uniref:p53 DNA-binding domain-containing protein n=1 Tax=Nephila pilipes TaxID=299642 RepID=A0A8X6TK97_NEPPI|nr:hypothetical protein NPIL_18471 [Nephila pilipes]